VYFTLNEEICKTIVLELVYFTLNEPIIKYYYDKPLQGYAKI
jgi:hypothetical protein